MLFGLCVILAPIVSGSQLSGIEQTGVTDTSAVPEAADRFPEPLPEPTPAELEATTPIPETKTSLYNSNGVWAFPGIIGPLGVMSQRSKQKSDLPLGQRQREYRILSVDKGSPVDGRLLPGDVIIGLDGGLFKPDKYVNKEVEVFKSYREPNWEMGRAIEKAYEENAGLITLTVRRKDRKGVVKVPLGANPGFAPTYPWNCPKSRLLCRQIAENYLKEKHGRLQPWMAAWYGIFLLNYDPTTYRAQIDEILEAVRKKLDERSVGGREKGILSDNNTWKVAAEAIFLAECAMLTGRRDALRRDCDRYAQLLFASRMLGNLWGHTDSRNYGSMYGGMMGASSQAGLALLCLKEAGAAVSQAELDKVLDSISASINKDSGRVMYSSWGSNNSLLPFDWEAIDNNTSQIASESIMRQGAVHLAMRLAGRMTEAEATYRYLRRQAVVFATHGMTQDAGVFEGVRSLASCNPEDCRALLDSYLPRLNMSLRWDSGLRQIPSGRDPRGKDEYATRERGTEGYMPAVMGLLLSMPEKRLYLFKHVLRPGDAHVVWPARGPRERANACSARHLTYAGDSGYFVAPDAAHPPHWAVYRHRFSGTSADGATTAIISSLEESPYELHVWKENLFVGGAGKKGAVMVWDIKRGGPHRLLNTYTHSRAAMFTEYADALYYISPQQELGEEHPYVGGELWRTRDGLTAERVDILGGGRPLWGILHGCPIWQPIGMNARSLQVVELGAGPRLFCMTQVCMGTSANRARPVREGPTQPLWVCDGTPGSARRFDPIVPERWPGFFQVLAVDNNNSRIGSLIGFEYGGRLFFSKDKQLHQSNREGTAFEPFTLDGRTFTQPNNFSSFGREGSPMLVFSFAAPDRTRKIMITDGTRQIAELGKSGDDGFVDIRYLTSVGDSLYFVGVNKKNGAALWHSDGTPGGTAMIRDFEPGPGSSLIENLVALGGRIYFTAWDEPHGTELWRHDPRTGRLTVADIIPGRASSRPHQMRAYGQWLVFAMDATVGGGGVLRYAEGEPNKHVSFAPAQHARPGPASPGR
jgi:ELWxxDGT repeat protein